MTFTDILADARFLTGTNSSTYTTADITRNANRALAEATALIFAADGRWQWDDSNYSTDPIATTDLVSGQQGYAFAVEHLKVSRVEVAGEDGTFSLLSPIDEFDVFDEALTELLSQDGTPRYYDKRGATLYLYPAPGYAATAGLKVYYQRTASEFATSDTTKQPGFASTFHRFVPLSAAYDYASVSGHPAAARIREERDRMAQDLKDFYSQRDSGDRPRLSARPYRFN